MTDKVEECGCTRPLFDTECPHKEEVNTECGHAKKECTCNKPLLEGTCPNSIDWEARFWELFKNYTRTHGNVESFNLAKKSLRYYQDNFTNVEVD